MKYSATRPPAYPGEHVLLPQGRIAAQQLHVHPAQAVEQARQLGAAWQLVPEQPLRRVLAVGMNPGDGLARYESSAGRAHRDHLVCRRCGRIVGFENDQIEALQERVAERHGFVVTDHRLELFGVCPACRGRSG